MRGDAYRGDAVVVGAGTAGMAFAIAAADRGLRVVAVEKADRVGGTLHVTGGAMSAAGTRRQRECGVEDSPEDHFEEVMKIGDGAADPDLVRMAVEEAPHTVDWLDDHGFPFAADAPGTQRSHEPYSTPREYWAPTPAARSSGRSGRCGTVTSPPAGSSRCWRPSVRAWSSRTARSGASAPRARPDRSRPGRPTPC